MTIDGYVPIDNLQIAAPELQQGDRCGAQRRNLTCLSPNWMTVSHNAGRQGRRELGDGRDTGFWRPRRMRGGNGLHKRNSRNYREGEDESVAPGTTGMTAASSSGPFSGCAATAN